MTLKEKRERAKDLRLQREYNITLSEYNKVLQYQEGCCAICKKKHGKKGQGLVLSVDHCHTTGLVRGLICWPCNKGIAVFQDSYKSLGNAASYLIAPPFSCVLSKDRFTVPGRVGTKIRAKAINALRGKGGSNKKRKTGKK
jgi:hypothetical protein